MNNNKISFVESVSLTLIVIISHILLNLPNEILGSTASSGPLNVIYISVLAVIVFLIFNKLFSPFKGKDILDVAEFVGGNILKKVVSIIYTLYIIFIAGILLLNFANTLKTIYLQDMPTELICLVFILIALIANQFGFKSVTRTNAIILPFIIVAILIIFFALSVRFVPERFFPILGYGVNNTFVLGSTNIFAFGEILLLFLMRSNYKDPKDSKKIGLTSIILSGIILFLSITSLLLIFPFATGGEGILSIYMITRSIQFGTFFQRVDAFFILIWVLTFFAYISVLLAFALKITNKNIKAEKSNVPAFLIAFGIFIVTLIPQNIAQIRFAENVIYKYSCLIIVFGMSFIILLLGYLKMRKKGLVNIETKEKFDKQV